MAYIKYKHHGKDVSVREDLKGKHREHCLCWVCRWFHPKNRELNCPIANRLFDFDVENHITTPVWECEIFEKQTK